MIYIVEEVTHVMVDKLHRGMKRRVTDVSNWIEKDSTVRARNFKNSAEKICEAAFDFDAQRTLFCFKAKLMKKI